VLDDGLGIVSKETLAEKLGYSWETEQANKDKERAAAPPPPAMPLAPGQTAVDPAQPVPPPAPFQPPKPDIAGRATSR
jgi:hypothetical protein